MKAMILAAGLGTRLKPITNHIPKALVEVNETPILQHIIQSLKKQGFNKIVINVHHFAEQIKDFLASQDFGLEISLSDETNELLDTGGGIVKAASLLFKDDNNPVLIHNVDILSNADLKKIMDNTYSHNDDCTLLISDRNSSRKLMFNKNMDLCGWHDLKNEKYKILKNRESQVSEYAFSGIYVMTKNGVEEMKNLMGEGKYSVMDYFINPLRKGKIKGCIQNNLKVLDIGKPATLSQASDLLSKLNSPFS